MVRITPSSINFFSRFKLNGKSHEFWLSLLLWLFLLTPFFILFGFFNRGAVFVALDASEVIWALKNTFLQAIGSSLLSVALGFLGALALLSLSEKSWPRNILEIIFLLPNFLPSLFVLTFALSVVDPFPMGTLGIVLVHTMINVGLVSVLWARRLQQQVGGQSQLAYIEGSSRWQFLKAMAGPFFISAREWALFTFIICFASFTVPLVVGGGRGTTLEVLIYEKLRVSGDIGAAFSLSILQGLFVLLFGVIFLKVGGSPSIQTTPGKMVWVLPSRILLGIATVIALGGSVYFVGQLLLGWRQVFAIYGLSNLALSLVGNTFLLGFSVSIFAMMILAAQASIFLNQSIHGRISKVISISPALVALAFSLAAGKFQNLALVYALTCLFYPSAVRLGMRDSFESLRAQQKMSWLLGASPLQTLLRITLPQISSQLVFVSSVVGLWAMGDFAVSKIILAKTETLGVLAESLMSSYRIDASFAICGLILILGLVLFVVLKGIAHVYNQKFS